jgi:acyl carrier protein
MDRAPTPTERTLQAIVAKRIDLAADDVPLDQPLLEAMGLDSFNLMMIILDVETAFSPLSLSEQPLEKLRTLADMAALIDRELAAGDSPQPAA